MENVTYEELHDLYCLNFHSLNQMEKKIGGEYDTNWKYEKCILE